MEDDQPTDKSKEESEAATLYADVREETCSLLWLQIPVAVTTFLHMAMRITSVIATGHLSVEEMGAVSLANIIANILSYATVQGLCYASETLFAQSFTANKKMMGVFLQRTFIVVLAVEMLVISLILNLRYILPFLKQSLPISEMTSSYLVLLIPSTLFEAGGIVLQRYLQAQNIVLLSAAAMTLANVVNITSQVIALQVFHCRYLATALCESVAFGVAFCAHLLYMFVSGVCSETWNGWTHRSLFNIGDFLKMALPGFCTEIVEVATFEVGILVMGTVSTVQMSAQAVPQLLTDIPFVIYSSLGDAMTIRIGQHLGNGAPEKAKLSLKTAFTLGTLSGVVLCALIVACRIYIPRIFSSDEAVIAAAAEGLKYYIPFALLDAIPVVLGCVLVAVGRQFLGFCIVFIGFVVIAQPVGISLALLTPMLLGGLWIGNSIGIAVEAVLYVIAICRLDWQKESELAIERCDEDDEIEEELDEASPSDGTHLLNGDVDTSRRKRAIVSVTIVYILLGCVLAASVLSNILQKPLTNVTLIYS